jgi:hypothetical protein
MAAAVCTVNDVLDGHVTLDVECLDRVYLNAYVPNLQVPGQVVVFLTQHLGNPIPSPAVFTKIGNAFRAAVERFAVTHQIPVVRFAKDARKQEVWGSPAFSEGLVIWHRQMKPGCQTTGYGSTPPRTRQGSASQAGVGSGGGCTSRRSSAAGQAQPPAGFGS